MKRVTMILIFMAAGCGDAPDAPVEPTPVGHDVWAEVERRNADRTWPEDGETKNCDPDDPRQVIHVCERYEWSETPACLWYVARRTDNGLEPPALSSDGDLVPVCICRISQRKVDDVCNNDDSTGRQ